VPVTVLNTGTFNAGTTPYVLPGTVGYLGSLSALTPYAPAGSAFPGAGNAPPGWTWTAAGLRNDTSPETLDHVRVYGGIYTAGNVITVTSSIIQAGTGGEIAPVQHHGAVATAGGKITVLDSTLGWLPGTMPPAGDDVPVIFDVNGPLYDVERCDCSGTPQGIDPPGSNMPGTPSLVLHNWIHGMVQNNTVTPNHMDGIFSQGGSDLLIQGNYVDAPVAGAVTAAIFFQDRTTTDSDVSVIGNYLSGGAFTFRNETVTGIVVTGNTFSGQSQFGDAANIAPGTIGTWSGNVHPDGSAVLSP